MKSLLEIEQENGVMINQTGKDGGCGTLYLHGTKSKPARVVFSWGGRLGTRQRVIPEPLPYVGGDVQGQGYILARPRVRGAVSPAEIRVCE